MKVDFNIRCENPGVVWAIKAALEKAGFRVHGCGVMIQTKEPDIDCSPPIDFVDAVPDMLQSFFDGSGSVPGGVPGPSVDIDYDDPNCPVRRP